MRTIGACARALPPKFCGGAYVNAKIAVATRWRLCAAGVLVTLSVITRAARKNVRGAFSILFFVRPTGWPSPASTILRTPHMMTNLKIKAPHARTRFPDDGRARRRVERRGATAAQRVSSAATSVMSLARRGLHALRSPSNRKPRAKISSLHTAIQLFIAQKKPETVSFFCLDNLRTHNIFGRPHSTSRPTPRPRRRRKDAQHSPQLKRRIRKQRAHT